MRLKYYNLSIIVPIFFLLGVLLTSFSFYIQKKEIEIGLKDEVTSISKAISIFLESKDIKKEKNSIENSFKKIIKHERVKRIFLIEKTKVLLRVEDDEIVDDRYRYEEAKLLDIEKGKTSEIFNNIVRIKDTPYKIFITIDATKEKSAMDYVFYQSIVIVLVIVIFGFIASSLLSYIAKRNINSLNNIANSIAEGDYKNYDKSFMIKEISDLNNTLDIVKSILKEILYKTKNSILDTDFTNKADDVIKPAIVVDEVKSVYKNDFEVSIAIDSKTAQRDFFNCWCDEKYIYTFTGELYTTSDYLKDYIGISSISKLIKYYLETNSFDIKKLKKMYDIKSIVTLKIDMATGDIFENRLNENNVSNNIIKLKDGEVKPFFHTYNVDERLKNYIQMYSYLSVDELIKDINKIFEKESAIIFVKKERA